MTTIAYSNRKIASDGQVSAGDRIDSLKTKKIRKVNSCLIGAAGRYSSALQFYDWFEKWSEAVLLQGESPNVEVFVPEGIDDEDFQAIVVFPDETVFIYEGGKRSYEMETLNGAYALGSGSDYALAAMDNGATAEEAVKIAINRDVYTGGEVFSEELDEEQEEITRDKANEMSKESLIELFFGKEEAPEKEDEEVFKVLFKNKNFTIRQDGSFVFTKKGKIVVECHIDDTTEGDPIFDKICKNIKKTELEETLVHLKQKAVAEDMKSNMLDQILETLAEYVQDDFVGYCEDE